MMKEQYIEANMDVIEFDNVDIIETSPKPDPFETEPGTYSGSGFL